MSLDMEFATITAEQLEFLQANPSCLSAFLKGGMPVEKPSFFGKLFGDKPKSVSLPADWPSEPIGQCVEIDHRQVSLWHYLLNGTHDSKPGVANLFQTWIKGGDGCAIRLNSRGSDDVFAHTPAHSVELVAYLADLADELIEKRLNDFDPEASQEDLDNAMEDVLFSRQCLLEVYTEARDSKKGVIWF